MSSHQPGHIFQSLITPRKLACLSIMVWNIQAANITSYTSVSQPNSSRHDRFVICTSTDEFQWFFNNNSGAGYHSAGAKLGAFSADTDEDSVVTASVLFSREQFDGQNVSRSILIVPNTTSSPPDFYECRGGTQFSMDTFRSSGEEENITLSQQDGDVNLQWLTTLGGVLIFKCTSIGKQVWLVNGTTVAVFLSNSSRRGAYKSRALAPGLLATAFVVRSSQQTLVSYLVVSRDLELNVACEGSMGNAYINTVAPKTTGTTSEVTDSTSTMETPYGNGIGVIIGSVFGSFIILALILALIQALVGLIYLKMKKSRRARNQGNGVGEGSESNGASTNNIAVSSFNGTTDPVTIKLKSEVAKNQNGVQLSQSE